MATIKATTTQGLYIIEDIGGKIATPGDIDLAGGVLGNTYIYFDTIIRFEHKITFNKEGPDFTGFHTWQQGIAQIAKSTGGGRRAFFMITVECDETTIENLEKLAILNVAPGDGKKYLVKQTAGSGATGAAYFRQFPNAAGTLADITPIIIRGVDSVEVADKGKDVVLTTILCEEIS